MASLMEHGYEVRVPSRVSSCLGCFCNSIPFNKGLWAGVVCLVRITLYHKFQLVLARFTGNWVCFGQLVRYDTEHRERVKLETLVLELFEWCVAWTVKVPRGAQNQIKDQSVLSNIVVSVITTYIYLGLRGSIINVFVTKISEGSSFLISDRHREASPENKSKNYVEVGSYGSHFRQRNVHTV